MEPNWNEIAKRLRISRENVPMEKDEAAKLIGLTRRALQNHETGARVNPRLIKRYASIYKVDPHWLMTGESSPGIVTEGAAPYGRISEVMVDGKPVNVTPFEPRGESERPESDPLYRQALAAMLEKDRENQRLRMKIEELTEKLATVRLFYLTHAAARQPEEIQPLLKQLDIPLDTNKHGEKS
jgi:DNA-binding XRE family transcriptional regulator